jgi:hypothetical protein
MTQKGRALKELKIIEPQVGGNPNPGLKSLRSNPPAREIKEKGKNEL